MLRAGWFGRCRGDGREEVGGFVGYQGAHGGVIGTEGAHGLVPAVFVGERGGLGPVAGWPLGRNVFGVAAEFEDVPLGDAHVLQNFPGRMRGALRAFAAHGYGCFLHCGLKSTWAPLPSSSLSRCSSRAFPFAISGF